MPTATKRKQVPDKEPRVPEIDTLSHLIETAMEQSGNDTTKATNLILTWFEHAPTFVQRFERDILIAGLTTLCGGYRSRLRTAIYEKMGPAQQQTTTAPGSAPSASLPSTNGKATDLHRQTQAGQRALTYSKAALAFWDFPLSGPLLHEATRANIESYIEAQTKVIRTQARRCAALRQIAAAMPQTTKRVAEVFTREQVAELFDKVEAQEEWRVE